MFVQSTAVLSLVLIIASLTDATKRTASLMENRKKGGMRPKQFHGDMEARNDDHEKVFDWFRIPNEPLHSPDAMNAATEESDMEVARHRITIHDRPYQLGCKDPRSTHELYENKGRI